MHYDYDQQKTQSLILSVILSVASALGLLDKVFPARCSPAATDNFSLAQGDSNLSISVDSVDRTFLVHNPGVSKPGEKLPLLIAFHGGGGQARGMPKLTGLNSFADKMKFIVVYPNGIDRGWNDGRPVPKRAKNDDVAFIRLLIDKLLTDQNIDSTRVYVTGISNGGFFTERLVLELPDKIAAAAVVVAGITKELAASESKKKAVPIMIILGTKDPLIPFAGGGVGLFNKKGEVDSAEHTAQFWATHNRCAAKGVTSTLPVREASDQTRVGKTVYQPQSGGQDVVMLIVNGGGHTWPSGSKYLPEALIGKVSYQISNDDIWQFLSSHHL